jgi:hypothetical protein
MQADSVGRSDARTERARTASLWCGSRVCRAPQSGVVCACRRRSRSGHRASPADLPAGFPHETRRRGRTERPAGRPCHTEHGGCRWSDRRRVPQGWLDGVGHEGRISTVGAYRNAVALVVAGLGEIPLALLTPLRVQQFETGLLAGDRPLSAKTVANVHAVLHRALADAVRLRMIDHNAIAAVRPPRVQRPQLTVWTAEELQTFLRSVRGHRWFPLFVLLATPAWVAARRSVCSGPTSTWQRVRCASRLPCR